MLFLNHIVSPEVSNEGCLFVIIVSDSHEKKNSMGWVPSPQAPLVVHKHLQGRTRDPFYFWLQIFPVWQHIWKCYVTNHTQRDNLVRNTVVSYSGQHELSFAYQGYYDVYKNEWMRSLDIFVNSPLITSCSVILIALADSIPQRQL